MPLRRPTSAMRRPQYRYMTAFLQRTWTMSQPGKDVHEQSMQHGRLNDNQTARRARLTGSPNHYRNRQKAGMRLGASTPSGLATTTAWMDTTRRMDASVKPATGTTRMELVDR